MAPTRGLITLCFQAACDRLKGQSFSAQRTGEVCGVVKRSPWSVQAAAQEKPPASELRGTEDLNGTIELRQKHIWTLATEEHARHLYDNQLVRIAEGNSLQRDVISRVGFGWPSVDYDADERATLSLACFRHPTLEACHFLGGQIMRDEDVRDDSR